VLNKKTYLSQSKLYSREYIEIDRSFYWAHITDIRRVCT